MSLKPSLTHEKLALELSSPRASEPHAATRVPLAFEAIYEQWFDEVLRWIRALGGPEADRDDLVQDVFLVVHRRLPHFDGRNVGGWLYQIARRKVRDFRRLFWVRQLFGQSVAVYDNLVDHAGSPLDALESKEQGKRLDALLSRLNPDQRAAFVLFELEGYSGEEIARLQRVPLNTVWARIHKARKKLQTRIAQRGKAANRWRAP